MLIGNQPISFLIHGTDSLFQKNPSGNAVQFLNTSNQEMKYFINTTPKPLHVFKEPKGKLANKLTGSQSNYTV